MPRRIGRGGPFLRQTLGDSSSSQLPTFVSNANAPQLANYSIVAGLGFFLASAVTPQGQANSAEYQHGTHAQAIHQAEIVKSDVFPSVRTPVVASATPLRQLQAAPEQIDLSISGWSIGGGQAPQGAVPAAIFAQQANPFQPQGSIWKSAVTTVVVVNPVAAFFSVSPQGEERPTRAIFPAVVSGQTTPVIPRANAAPQLADLTLKGSIFPSATAPTVVAYALRPVYGAPQAIDLTQQGWTLAPGPAPQGRVPAGIFAPQADPSQTAALVIQAAVTPPVAATGPVPRLVLTRQDDPTQLAALLWRSIDIGSPPTPPAVQQPGMPLSEATREPRRHRPPFRRHDLSEFYDDFSEEQFLESVEETIVEAEKPGKPELTREIGQLSALDVLARAYGVHFENIKAARRLIQERRLVLVEEISEEEMFAIMMILAMADEP